MFSPGERAPGGWTGVTESRTPLALTLNGTKAFPTRDSLLKFMKSVSGKSERAVMELLDRTVYGVSTAIAEAILYGREHALASRFSRRLVEVMTRGLDRLGYKPIPISATRSGSPHS